MEKEYCEHCAYIEKSQSKVKWIFIGGLNREAYHITDLVFENFIKDNALPGPLDSIEVDGIMDISDHSKKSWAEVITREPWCVHFIGRRKGPEGYIHVFIDCNMDKIYEYYDN